MHNKGTIEVMQFARGAGMFEGDGLGEPLSPEERFLLECDGEPVANFDKVRLDSNPE